MFGRRRRAAGRRVAVLALAALLPGCWLQIGATPGHTRHNWIEAGLTAENVDTLHQVWSVEVPGTLSEPMVSEGRVFVTRSVTTSAWVQAVDAGTGSTLWNTNLVAVPSVEGALAAGTAVTFVGDRLWTGFLGVAPPLTPGGGGCTLGSNWLDPATGAKTFAASSFSTPAVSAAPVVARVSISGPPDSPCALFPDPTITLEVVGSAGGGWRADIAGQPLGSYLPSLTSDQVFLSHGTSLDAFTTHGCTANCMQWTKTIDPAPSTPVVDDASPVFVTSGQDLVALAQADGTELWRAPLGGLGTGIALANGTVYVSRYAAEGGHALLAFDAGGCGGQTCAPVWQSSVLGPGISEPVVAGGVVYVATGERVLAFDADGCPEDPTCLPLASVAVPGGRLSLSNGRLFVAGGGRLTALAASADDG